MKAQQQLVKLLLLVLLLLLHRSSLNKSTLNQVYIPLYAVLI